MTQHQNNHRHLTEQMSMMWQCWTWTVMRTKEDREQSGRKERPRTRHFYSSHYSHPSGPE